MGISYDAFPQLLRDRVAGFDAVYAEHLEDYDEVLPHVLVGDLLRFITEVVVRENSLNAAVNEAMRLLEEAASGSDPRLQELVAVSFVENLEPQECGFDLIRGAMGPVLAEQYQVYEDARA